MMALTFSQEIVSSKIGFLTKRRDYLSEQRNYLQTVIDEANEVIQMADSWLTNMDGTNNCIFTDINKIIEDKLVFLSSPEFSVDWDKIKQESTTSRSLPAICTDQPYPAKHDKVSVAQDELETIMSQVKEMQESISILTTKTANLSEKQLTTEKCIESLADKYSLIEQEKIEEIEKEWKKNYEKQKASMELLNNRIKNIEKKIKTLTDAQSDVIENCHQQQIKIKEQKKESEKQSQQFTNDLNDIQENVQKLSIEVYLLKDQTLVDSQLEYLENKVASLEENSENLSVKLEEHVSSLEEFIRKTEETVKNLSSVPGSECEKLQKFEEKIGALETSWSETSQEAKRLYQDGETKYNTMCEFVSLRLGPLERLRDIFNEKLDARKANLKKLDSACDQITDFPSTFPGEGTVKQGQAVGFSVRAPWSTYLISGTTMKSFIDVIANSGNHFDPLTGVFIVPQDGLYATSIYIQRTGAGSLSLAIMKQPCACHTDSSCCRKCTVCDIVTEKDDRNTSIFVVVELKVGDKLSLKCKCADNTVVLSPWTVFSCVKIG